MPRHPLQRHATRSEREAQPPPTSADSAREPVGLLIGAARRRIKQVVGRRLKGRGLTPPQFWVLLAVQEGRAPSVSALAELMHGDQPTASRIVAALVKRKLVRVEADPADRRRARLVSTAAGDALRPELSALAGAVREAIVAGMGEDEQEAMRRGLRKVMDNMDRFERGETPARGAGRKRRG
jgi:DNA-binding MarR family transcriptional regulator